MNSTIKLVRKSIWKDITEMHHSLAIKSNRAKPAGFLSMLLGHIMHYNCYNIITTIVITIVTTYFKKQKYLLNETFFNFITNDNESLSHYLQLMAAEFWLGKINSRIGINTQSCLWNPKVFLQTCFWPKHPWMAPSKIEFCCCLADRLIAYWSAMVLFDAL